MSAEQQYIRFDNREVHPRGASRGWRTVDEWNLIKSWSDDGEWVQLDSCRLNLPGILELSYHIGENPHRIISQAQYIAMNTPSNHVLNWRNMSESELIGKFIRFPAGCHANNIPEALPAAEYNPILGADIRQSGLDSFVRIDTTRSPYWFKLVDGCEIVASIPEPASLVGKYILFAPGAHSIMIPERHPAPGWLLIDDTDRRSVRVLCKREGKGKGKFWIPLSFPHEIADVPPEEKPPYDFNANCEAVAKERGLQVVFPRKNQLQIDVDSEEAFVEFERRLACFAFPQLTRVDVVPSASGLPHRHITLSFATRKFSEWERIALQACLGSDPIREFMNAMRFERGEPRPSRLFQQKSVSTQTVDEPQPEPAQMTGIPTV